MNLSNHLLLVLPEILLLVMSCVTLLASLFVKQKSSLPYYMVQATLIVAAVLTWHAGRLVSPGQTIYLFYNAFAFDSLAVVLKMFIYLSAFVAFVYSHRYNNERFIPSGEFHVLALLSVLGMMVLVSAHNLMPLFLGLELFSLPIYTLVALQRGKVRCIEAAMKYFVIGAVASGMLLYGFSMIFGLTKSLDLTQIAQFINAMPSKADPILIFATVFIIAGVAFKLGAAPFHMWVPDVYDGAPNSVTLFLSTAPKLAAFALLIRLLVDALPGIEVQWQHMMIVVAILSIAIGNIVAIAQSNIKRMLAYSSVAHMGYMLLGIACLTDRGYSAALFYIISYSIITLGAFGMIALMSRSGFEATEISDFSGLNSRSPWLAFMMLIILFSLAGVPPLVGFIAKVAILEALIKAHLVWLAVVAIVFAIIGVYYYIRVVKVMYFETPEKIEPITVPTDTTIAITLNGIAVLLMGIFPGLLFTLCHNVFLR